MSKEIEIKRTDATEEIFDAYMTLELQNQKVKSEGAPLIRKLKEMEKEQAYLKEKFWNKVFNHLKITDEWSSAGVDGNLDTLKIMLRNDDRPDIPDFLRKLLGNG